MHDYIAQPAAAKRKACIGEEEIKKADDILSRYRAGKSQLDKRIQQSEDWYKLRHWEYMEHSDSEVQPVSAWLFNCLATKHADAMDAFPSPNILPREESDKAQAKMLSSIVPVILDQCDFEQVYSDVMDYKLRTGTGVYGVFWDSSALNGMGNINITQADVLTLFWEPGIRDIQDSPHFFAVEGVDNEQLIAQYPELKDKLSGGGTENVQYNTEDQVDRSNKSPVVSWYYKADAGGRTVVQYVQYTGNTVLYSSEDDPEHPEYGTEGFYQHGMFPYIFDPLFRVAGAPTGFGYVDIGKSPQEYIDRGNQAAMESMAANASPRYLSRKGSGISKDQFADMTNKIIDFEGDPNAIIPIKTVPINSSYIQLINNKIEELKETTGNRDSNNGGTTTGVTAAAAIAAMQEAGAKLPRDSNKGSYRAFRRIVLMCIELIRQFFDAPRCFRITGEQGQEEFVEYSNAGIKPQPQDTIMGINPGDRIPLFDIKIVPQKANPYSQMAQNELAMQLYDKGFFVPQLADQALACLEMMDFDGKQNAMNIISQNGTMYEQLLAMQQTTIKLAGLVDNAYGTNMLAEMGAAPQSGPMPPTGGRRADLMDPTGESTITRNARAQTAQAIQPR